jgi:uncharacterized protein (DUF305 family)
MTFATPRSAAAIGLALSVSAVLAAAPAPIQAPPAATPAQASPVKPGYVDADVEFMSGMIPHHAQAVLIAGWAPTHGSRADVKVLCERIVVGQRDEIALMRQWLSDRGEEVPAADATHHKMKMNGMEHDMLMPGMLSDEQLKALDKARGLEWDRMFLDAMIKHHQGAISMVDVLFKSFGAAQDEVVFRFASDVYADQSTEIDRMQKMLAEITASKSGGRFEE